MHLAFKAISGKSGADITDSDSYYIGMTLTYTDDVTAWIIDGNGKKLELLNLTVLRHGTSRSHSIPIPVLALGGIQVNITDSAASWTVYYAEQVGGHKHV